MFVTPQAKSLYLSRRGKLSLLKISKFQKQIFLFSFAPKTGHHDEVHPIFLKIYNFMFRFMSSLIKWDVVNVVILVLIFLITHVWLREF